MLRRARLAVALASLAVLATAAAPVTAAPLPRSSPEAQGVPSAALLDLVESAERDVDTPHSVMVLRHGHVIAEGWWTPYDAASPHMLFSLSKSFTSTAVGIAAMEGKLSIDDPVLNFFGDEAPQTPSDNLKMMRVRDLLTMATGQHSSALETFTWDSPDSLVKAFLAAPVEHKPGTFWWYNTPATFMQSAIVQKVSGEKLVDYLRPRLFEPLGIESPTWREVGPAATSMGGSGLNIRTEDIAKFGQLLLQKGKWEDKQLVPAEYVEMAGSKQMSNGSAPDADWDAGYGFQFWVCQHGAFRADGAFGQLCIVMPKQDAVVVFTSGCPNGDLGTRKLLALTWEKFLPALKDAAIESNADDEAKLNAKLASLQLKMPEGSPTSGNAGRIAGKRFLLPANDLKLSMVTLAPGESRDTLTLHDGTAAYAFEIGHGEWTKGESAIGQGVMGVPILEKRPQPYAASGAWTADDTYAARIAFTGTPLRADVKLKFEEQNVSVEIVYYPSFSNTPPKPVRGAMIE